MCVSGGQILAFFVWGVKLRPFFVQGLNFGNFLPIFGISDQFFCMGGSNFIHFIYRVVELCSFLYRGGIKFWPFLNRGVKTEKNVVQGVPKMHFLIGVLENAIFLYRGSRKYNFVVKGVSKMQFFCIGGSRKWHFVILWPKSINIFPYMGPLTTYGSIIMYYSLGMHLMTAIEHPPHGNKPNLAYYVNKI